MICPRCGTELLRMAVQDGKSLWLCRRCRRESTESEIKAEKKEEEKA